jgi:hypothetical protein
MSTKDQLLYSALHGTAIRYAAERRNLDESIEELRQIADGSNDVLAEAAGITAGSWYASPATHVGYELGCSSSREAAAVCRWTMTSWSAGRAWDSSAERRQSAAGGDFATLTRVRKTGAPEPLVQNPRSGDHHGQQAEEHPWAVWAFTVDQQDCCGGG